MSEEPLLGEQTQEADAIGEEFDGDATIAAGRHRRDPEWNRTILVGERLRSDPRYEEPDIEAPNGHYDGKRIIGRDAPINEGVYLGAGPREAIVVDDTGEYKEVYDRVYGQLKAIIYDYVAKHPDSSVLDKVIGPTYDLVRELMPYDGDKVDNFIAGMRDTETNLAEFINAGAGVCRHQALLVGYLLERLQRDKELMQEDEISIDRNTIKGILGHAWVRYKSSDGTVYIVDPAQGKKGKLEDMQGYGWEYRRPEDIYPVVGEGSQYMVLDIGDDRVKKIPQSHKRTKRLFSKWYSDHDEQSVNDRVDEAIHDRQTSSALVSYLTRYYPDIRPLLCNPVFEGDETYTQDKITSLEETLGGADTEKTKAIIAQYLITVQTLWMYGIHDKVSNFQTAYGTNKEGDIVLMDFGEITDDEDRVREFLNKAGWRDAWNFSGLPEEIREYYDKAAREKLSLENFERLWKARLKKSIDI